MKTYVLVVRVLAQFPRDKPQTSAYPEKKGKKKHLTLRGIDPTVTTYNQFILTTLSYVTNVMYYNSDTVTNVPHERRLI